MARCPGSLRLRFSPSIDRKSVRKLPGLGFVERTENVVLLGRRASARPTWPSPLQLKAVEAGYSVLFLALESQWAGLVRAGHENRPVRTLQGAEQAMGERQAFSPVRSP